MDLNATARPLEYVSAFELCVKPEENGELAEYVEKDSKPI